MEKTKSSSPRLMSKRNINKIVKSVCNCEVQCPVFAAYETNCAKYTGQHCFELDECPFRAALEIYADIERGIVKVER